MSQQINTAEEQLELIEKNLRSAYFSTGAFDKAARNLLEAAHIEATDMKRLKMTDQLPDEASGLWNRSSLLAALRRSLRGFDTLQKALHEKEREAQGLAAQNADLEQRIKLFSEEGGQPKIKPRELAAGNVNRTAIDRAKLLEIENRELKRNLEAAAKKIDAIEKSTSWRITAPMRSIRKLGSSYGL